MIGYYNFADLKRMSMSVREMIENIYLVVKKKWNFEDERATKKMIETFKHPEEELAELMAIKEVTVAGVPSRLPFLKGLEIEKKFEEIPENPEDFLLELVNAGDIWHSDRVPVFGEDDRRECEKKLKVLSMFVLKIAVYRFFTVYFPKMMEKDPHLERVYTSEINLLKNEMEDWERFLWEYDEEGMKCSMWKVKTLNFDELDLFQKRKVLRQEYEYSPSVAYEDCSDMQECVERAFMDKEMVEVVKKIQKNPDDIHFFLDKSHDDITVENGTLVEIQNMKQLLDIMEREIQGKQTEMDSILLKENAERWSKDIQKLLQMLDKR